LDRQGQTLAAQSRSGDERARLAYDAWAREMSSLDGRIAQLARQQQERRARRHQTSPLATELAAVTQQLVDLDINLGQLVLDAAEGVAGAADRLAAAETAYGRLTARQRGLERGLAAEDQRAEQADRARWQEQLAALRQERDAASAQARAAEPAVVAAVNVLLDALAELIRCEADAGRLNARLPASLRSATAGGWLVPVLNLLRPLTRVGVQVSAGPPIALPAFSPSSTPSQPPLSDKQAAAVVRAAELPLPLDPSKLPLGYTPTAQEWAERSATATVRRYAEGIPADQRRIVPELPAPALPPPRQAAPQPPPTTPPAFTAPVVTVPDDQLDQARRRAARHAAAHFSGPAYPLR
jgi:hypothetical protein